MNDDSGSGEFSVKAHSRLKQWCYVASALLLTFATTHSDVTGAPGASGVAIKLGEGFSARDGLLIVVLILAARLSMTWPGLPIGIKQRRIEVLDHCSALTFSALAASWHVYDSDVTSPWRMTALGLAVACVVGVLYTHGVASLVARFLSDELFDPWVTSNDEIARRATLTLYLMYFCPDDTSMNKVIEFLPGGEIGRGQNLNEYKWHAQRGRLEIFNKEGVIYSRFRFRKSTLTWHNTNDWDTQSIRSQYMTALEKEALQAAAVPASVVQELAS